jgi:hypothetical protein
VMQEATEVAADTAAAVATGKSKHSIFLVGTAPMSSALILLSMFLLIQWWRRRWLRWWRRWLQWRRRVGSTRWFLF